MYFSKDEVAAYSVDDHTCLVNSKIKISQILTQNTFLKIRWLHTVLMIRALMMAMTKMTAVMTIMVTVLLDVILANEGITDSVEISQNQPRFCSSLYRSRPLD